MAGVMGGAGTGSVMGGAGDDDKGGKGTCDAVRSTKPSTFILILFKK